MSDRPSSRREAFLLRLAINWIPAPFRARYGEELRAELAELPPAERNGYLLAFVRGVPALRWALRGALPRRSLRCRIGWHSNARVHDNPENRRAEALVCRRCGRVHDRAEYDRKGTKDVNALAWGTVHLPH